MSRLWLYLAVALPVLGSVIAPMSTVDLAYHLRAGGGILDTRAIPSVDAWTFTATGLPWTDQQWGAQVVLAAVYRLGGWTAPVLLRGLLTAIIFAATLTIARRRDLDTRFAAILTLLAFVVAAPAMALRPQLFGMACFAITLLLIAGRRERPRGLWLVPVVALGWANVHGSFILAPLLLGLAWVEDLHDRAPTSRRTLVAGFLTVIAACVTPFGPGVWAYAVGLSANPSVTDKTSEWQPTSLREASGLLFFASVASVVALIARAGRRVPWPALLWLGVFASIGVVAQRGVAWWPFVAVATVSGLISGGGVALVGRPVAEGSRPLNVVVAALVAIAGIVLLPVWRPVDGRTGVPGAVLTDAPAGITDAVRSSIHDNERVLNPQRWGSWLEFAVPDALVAVDSRIELFPAKTWDEFEAVAVGLDSWQETLARWGVGVAVVEAADRSLHDRLVGAGWSTTYEDGDGWVLLSPPS
jgi:hypothetical protein